VNFISARISHLKLTVPADILTSSIVIEISGVEVRLSAESKNENKHESSRREQRKAPAKGTRSNRPRIATPTVHDPGGERAARYGLLEDPLFHPDLAAHQLAESFLQSESREDRIELQAAITSQSRVGREALSSSTVSDEEIGVGVGEGYTLPSFIASYLVGIADRLQLHLNDIALHVEFHDSYDFSNSQQTESTHSTKFLLKLAELSIEGVDAIQDDHNGGTGKRKAVLHQFSILVLPDPASDSSGPGSSETTSPVLKHSQASPSSSSSTFHAAQALRPAMRHNKLADEVEDCRSNVTFPEEIDQSMSSRQSAPAFSYKPSTAEPISVDIDNAMDDSLLCTTPSRVIDPSGNFDRSSPPTSDHGVFQEPGNIEDNPGSLPRHQDTNSSCEPSPGDIDNQVHAASLAKFGQFAPSVIHSTQIGQPVEDLTESKIFTHDEAESMYMSAVGASDSSVGTTKPMPGAWTWAGERAGTPDTPSYPDSTQSTDETIPPSTTAPVVDSRTFSSPQAAGFEKGIFGNDGPADSLQSLPLVARTGKQILVIDRISAWLPAVIESGRPTTPTIGQVAQVVANSRDAGRKGYVNREAPVYGNLEGSSKDDGKTRNSVADSGDPDGKSTTKSIDSRGTIEIEVLNMRSQFDMRLGKTLIAIANLIPRTSEESIKGSKPSGTSAAIPTLSLKISNIAIAFLEHVPELPISDAATESSYYDEALLLSVSLAGLGYRISLSNGALQQQMQLSKMSLSHSKGHFLSFSNDPRMRLSLKDSVALQKNDVEISVTSSTTISKVEIHTKPIRLILELGQLDEILSRSGGLSSLLELGSSIASSSTVRTSHKDDNERRAEPRGVRFELGTEMERRTQDDLSVGLGKVNVRMGGVNVDVVGSECIMRASTSAVKIVHRTEGVGMQIDRVLLQGPFLLGSNEAPDLSANLEKIRVEYLPVPNDKDLDRLLAILTPSKDKYDADDDIMVDTLLRQRRKGGVLRLTVTSLVASLEGMSRMAHLAKIGTELGKLSTVAKYLPEDDRPGILSLGLVKTFEFHVELEDPIGRLHLKAQALEGAHVNVPSLLASQIGTASIERNDVETIFGEAVTYSDTSVVPPMIMCRFVADEMDPTVKLKLFNSCVQYHVTLVADLMKLADSLSNDRTEDGSEKSIPSSAYTSSPPSSESAAEFVRRTNISVAIRDSALALNPRDVCGRALFVVTDAVFSSPLNENKEIKVSTEIKKAFIMVIDKIDADGSSSDTDRHSVGLQTEDQTRKLIQMGYVPVGTVSSATTTVDIAQLDDGGGKCIDVELGNALLIIESCADSTQTLITILNGLSPPAPPVKISPYRTEIMPIEDLLASFSGDAFVTEPGPEAGLRAEPRTDSDSTYSEHQDIEYVSEFYQPDPDDEDDISESGIHSEMLDSDLAQSTVSISVAPVSIKQSVTQAAHNEGMTSSLLDFRDEHFGRTSAVGGTAHRWDSTQNTYGLAGERNARKSPLKVRIRDVHIIWNLFDGYDWQGTRDIISEAVKDIETRAAARRPRSSNRLSPNAEDEEDSVIGDFLFNSIYIGIPANKDPRELANEINRDIDDLTSESGSSATTSTITGSPARHQAIRPRQKKLTLKRSKRHKMTFELKGVSADMLVFPPESGEVQSSIDVRVKDFEIFDHIPTSTWKKFATYMRDAGEREADTSMVHIEILNVKPVPDLAASEMILKVTILPLRLHVDQDALDFMSRFFEFKDESAPAQSAPSTPPFLQRVEVNPVKIKLDFKPKRVDYGGLRSGRTTEFMNFFILDQADMILRRVILYGVSGFDRLGIMLNNIWMPDVKRNQLPGILAGLAPIRSLVNVGSGVKDLVVVPMREYKKDGRIVRSIQKGALAFAKTTSKELIGLGAKLAIGTQTVLQNAETMLAPTPQGEHLHHAWEDLDTDDESQKQISLYADQPIGVVQGLRGAYASLERDLLLAKDAIIAVPGEAMASGSATGAAKAILKQAPTVILRPAIGASKAVGQTLLGAGNTLDRENWRRMEEVGRLVFLLFGGSR
jgi:autophagy-related protein 2